MTVDVRNVLARLLREAADRPLGDIQLGSNWELSRSSRAMWSGAENLLIKASRALRAGDGDRAAALVNRAVSLPFDDLEGAAPAAIAAHMLLFSSVTDALEESSAADQRWLDSAIDVLDLPDSADPARSEMRHVLAEVDNDYDLPPEERRRLRRATEDVPKGPEPADMLDLTADELADWVHAILRAWNHYEDVLRRSEP